MHLSTPQIAELRPPTSLLILAALIACSGSNAEQSAGAINSPFSVAGVRVEADSLNAYLASHRGFTSKGGEMRCAYRPLGQHETTVFVWAMCSELLAVDGRLIDGSGMSLPAAFQIKVESGHSRIVGVEVPQDGSGYGASIRRIFPSTTWPAIFAEAGEHPRRGLQDYLRREAAARFGLPAAVASAPRVHDMPGAELTVIDSGSFAMIVRGDTTAVDEFVRRQNLLEGIVRTRRAGAKFGWARYRVEFTRSGEAARSQLSLGRVGTSPDGPAVGTYAISLGPDSIVEEWPNRSPTRTPWVRGVIPLFDPSIAMFQEVVRRARRTAPSLLVRGVPVYPVLSNATMRYVPVRWISRDTALIGDPPAGRYLVDGWKILRAQHGDIVAVRRMSASSSATLDSAARRVVEFLRGRIPFEQTALGDTVAFYASPEGGGGRAKFARQQLRQPSAWVVRTMGHNYPLAPPKDMAKLTTKVGRHLNCGEQPLAAKFPQLARFPHVGTMLQPQNFQSCLQTWNMTFVFDTTAHPRVIAVAYDQAEW